MARSVPQATGRIFLSYRREETAYPAGWLFDRLADQLSSYEIFKDVDSIEPGDDFVAKITNAVESCEVLLALIGDRWLTITDEHGSRRLDNPDDFVRLEVEAALQRRIRVIPVLVDGARMPEPDELPPALAGLGRRQALELSPNRFAADTNRLLKVLRSTLALEGPPLTTPGAEAPTDASSGVPEAEEPATVVLSPVDIPSCPVVAVEQAGGEPDRRAEPEVRLPAAPAQWAPDPFGRHGYRYWDGVRWTEHVGDGGVLRSDPPEHSR